MNISNSECSSGCESGWTMYLDQSSNSANQFQKASTAGFTAANDKEYDEDEDLSMVSDASSGPPHLEEDEDSFDGNRHLCSVSGQPNKKDKKKKKVKEQRSKQQFSNLDDTASSPVKKHVALPSPNGTSIEHNMGFSQGFSATHFKGKSALRKQYIGFFHSSAPGKPASGAPGDLQGRKWE